jgi:pSer/pThr/pTyr-binding forkhead associated (FHA) protein
VADVRVRRDGERWLLRDIGSRNGTRLNGARVTDEVEARPGDQISLGGVRYRLSAR